MIRDTAKKQIEELELLRSSALLRDNKSARDIINNAIGTIAELSVLYSKALNDVVRLSKEKENE